MDVRQLNTFTPPLRTTETRAPVQMGLPGFEEAKADPLRVELPLETYAPEVTSQPTGQPAGQTPSIPDPATVTVERRPPGPESHSYEDGRVVSLSHNGPLLMIEGPAEPAAICQRESSAGRALTLAEVLQEISVSSVEKEASTAKAMSEREDGYLKLFPYKDDAKSLETRAALNARYNDPSTSAESMTKTVAKHAHERGIEIDQVPENLVGDLSSANLGEVKAAAQAIIDKLFLSKDASMNPEKHATVSKETQRFLDLAMQVAPKGFTAGDAYKLVAGNLALISYQDKAAAENMLGDHGVRHLLGHNINACEELADGLEKRGIPVNAMDRLVMHQAMIVHDLGYAMDSVRNPINSEGLKGQDAGHNVLAARYLRERSQNPDDPLAKLFGQGDLERMHRCVLYHDKDKTGGPGVQFQMKTTLSPDDRAINLETMTRVADNSHAFEDKLPELLYRKPESLKAMRLMKTAGELGDTGLVEDLKQELADHIRADSSLAKDDMEALLQSVSSVHAQSYQFSVGRIAGCKPSFDVGEDGKVKLSVTESGLHQQTSALFGMQSYKQMEKFVKDCAGEKVSLHGNNEVIDGKDVCVIVSGPGIGAADDEFNTSLTRDLLQDKPFVKFALLDSQLAEWQTTLQERQKLGKPIKQEDLDEVKAQRRALLEAYRAGSAA